MGSRVALPVANGLCWEPADWKDVVTPVKCVAEISSLVSVSLPFSSPFREPWFSKIARRRLAKRAAAVVVPAASVVLGLDSSAPGSHEFPEAEFFASNLCRHHDSVGLAARSRSDYSCAYVAV